MIGPLGAVQAFVQTKWQSRRSRPRASFQAWQTRTEQKWLETSLPKAPFYKTSPRALAELPITDKAMLMADFEAFNIHGLTCDQGWRIEATGGRFGDLTIGASTGTSGNRGLFVISEREKMRWLGTILAKTMADMMWRPQRVAIILPQDTGLYSSANRMRFIRLRTFSSSLPIGDWLAELEKFDPTIIVAPPKVLRQFAEMNFSLSPRRVFSAAETLDPIDETIAAAFFQQPIRQIYMATEGLLGVSCAHGTIHLAEDSIKFEFEDAEDGLVVPLITGFRRDTQIMARYRMNDLLRLIPDQCACGSPLQGVSEIVGRMDDVFVFGNTAIMPSVLRNAVLQADGSILDFRLHQISDNDVVLKLGMGTTDKTAERALSAVKKVFDQFNVNAKVSLQRTDLRPPRTHKLRRIKRLNTSGVRSVQDEYRGSDG